MKKLLERSITLLVLPPADFPLWRAQLTLKTTLGLLAAWTALTLWTGFKTARQVDYLATKADNQVLHQRIAKLVDELEASGDDLTRAKQADAQLRELLKMPSREAIIEGQEEERGQGGPVPADSRAILSRFAQDPAHVSPEAFDASVEALKRQSQENVASTAEILHFVDRKRWLFRATPLGWPADGHVTSPFGYRLSPMGGQDGGFGEFHPGMDIASSIGTPINVTADGVVERAGWAGGYGQVVVIRHNAGFATLYGHTSRILVRVGQSVRRGQTIALMGSTGRSTGPHVHYEVWRNGKQINPAPFLKQR